MFEGRRRLKRFRAAVGAGIGLILLVSAACGLSSHPQQADPMPGPRGRGPALAIPLGVPATPSSSPEPFTQIPFAFPPGPNARLVVYDLPRLELITYPGAGPGIEFVSTMVPGQYLYDDTRDIFLYDAWREEQVKLVDGDEVGGFAFYPSMSGDQHLYFLGQSKPALAARFIGLAYVKYESTAAPIFGDLGGDTTSASPSATPSVSPSPTPGETASPTPSESESPAPSPTPSPLFDTRHYATSSTAPSITVVPGPEINWYLAKPRFLTKINALAVLHGGVTSISSDVADTAVVFTTGDGGLYLYTPRTPQVVALLPNETIEDGFHAEFATIDPIWGRFIVWHDSARRGILTLDRWTGQVDVMPYANIALNAVDVSFPGFMESDPYHVVFTVTLADGTFRIVCYNLVTEQVLNLSLLNELLTAVPKH